MIGVDEPRDWAAIRAVLAPLQATWLTILAIIVEIEAQGRELMPDLIGASIVPLPGGHDRPVAASSTGC